MPIRIFCAPGDHRNDFKPVEDQVNRWISEVHPQIVHLQTSVNAMPGDARLGEFMMTIVVHYDSPK